MAYCSTSCPSGPDHLSPAKNVLGCKPRTVLGLMNPCPEDHVGQCEVKMEAMYNRRNCARRRFEVGGFCICEGLSQIEEHLDDWIRVNQLLDVFDLPLFHSRTDIDDEDAKDLPTLPRSSCLRQAPDRLNVDPTKKTYL
ncbi:hypothetical protein ANCCAN_03029 [Ancylostoma caninum]|uniref:Uncharacterized protein n=1 Tax=Ancylostoma caninum TaxID=29170 RepID=A0A368H6A8_ANCCA|nr:hypothetical protein ANCCAN_03029 [Ancylostoma caninum]